jgi:hypothetical protein
MFQSLDKVVLGRIVKNELIWSALTMWQCRVVEWQLNKSYRWYHSILISTWHTWTISMKHNMTCKKQPCSAKTGRFWSFLTFFFHPRLARFGFRGFLLLCTLLAFSVSATTIGLLLGGKKSCLHRLDVGISLFVLSFFALSIVSPGPWKTSLC